MKLFSHQKDDKGRDVLVCEEQAGSKRKERRFLACAEATPGKCWEWYELPYNKPVGFGLSAQLDAWNRGKG